MKNPTLLTLMKQGQTVTFQSGYKIVGDPHSHSIYLFGVCGADGLEELSRAGVDRILSCWEPDYRKGVEV